jgi:signal transduction histidine kinase
LSELAAYAERIGRGDFDVDVPRYDVPEADAVGRALRASAHDLGTLVRRERDFAAHASHELRTPITATRLEIEDLALSSQPSPEVASRLSAALGQLDRLSATVAEMLDASRESRVGATVDIDLAALVRDTVARWRALAPGRRIDAECDGVVAVRMPAGALMQVMDVLIGNAVKHGEGDVRVTVTETAAYAEVRVGDDGSRDHAASRVRNPETPLTGGLATAAEIAASLGGQLRLTDDVRTTFSLVLPRVVRERVVQ